MSKTDRLSYIRDIASRPARILNRLSDAGCNVNQARRVMRRVCPRLNLNSA